MRKITALLLVCLLLCGVAAAGDYPVAGCGSERQCLERKKAHAGYRKLFAQFRRESG